MHLRHSLALALALWGTVLQAEPQLRFVGSAAITTAGGLSGIELDSTGGNGILVSDRGDLFALTLARKGGQLHSAAITPWPKRSRLRGDVEGIASLDFQHFTFALEGPGRLIALSPNGKTTRLPRHSGFDEMGSNRALEAVAIDAQGHIYTLPEKSSSDTAPFPLFAFKSGAWEVASHLPRRGPFWAVGADFGPDGRFYLLERAVTFLGFRTRIRRFDLSAPDLSEQTLLSTWPARHDNLEGIAVWRDGSGATRITMVADDNFLRLLRSEVVEYVLSE